MRKIARPLTTLPMLMVLGCVPLRGGWDVGALEQRQPQLASLRGHRLGDMLPFPALDGGRLALLGCRFATDQKLRLGFEGSGAPAAWVEAAIRGVNRRVRGVEMAFDHAGEAFSEIEASIQLAMIDAIDGPGPSGLGDTLSRCDVSPDEESESGYRGEMVRAEIRMRRAQRDVAHRVRTATAEEWIGALMHEVGHALGFAGHAATGDSIMVRDQTRLRAAGRRALADEGEADRTLSALYALAPGVRLGERQPNAEGVRWLEVLGRMLSARAASGPVLVAVHSSVGDIEARVVWRYADGSQLGFRLPHWRAELEGRTAITLAPISGPRKPPTR